MEKKENQEWDSGLEKPHTECPYKSVTLILRAIDYLKIKKCNEIFKDTEYSLYFNTEKINENTYRICEIIIPEQEVTSVSVDYKEGNHAFGVIHKHPAGLQSFSGIDNDYINSNHDMSVLVTDTSITGTARIKTPCGCIMQTELTILIEEIENPEISEFITQAKERIKEKKVEFTMRETQNILGYSQGCTCVVCREVIPKKKKFKNCLKCGLPMCKACYTQNQGICDTCEYGYKSISDEDEDETFKGKPLNQMQPYLF